MDKSSINLVDLCRRMNCAWQFLDTKMTTEKLISIREKCLYPKASEITLPTHIPVSYLDTLVCTKFFLEKDISDEFSSTQENTRTTAKTFFGENKHFDNLTFKERQVIYWMIRLRWGCGIITVAILNMIDDLKQLGYKSWILPNGDMIPLSGIWLGDLVIVPNQYRVVYKGINMMGSVVTRKVEPIEHFYGISEEGPYCYHSVILMNVKSILYVADPTSLQFGMQGHESFLTTYLPWDEYKITFPGKIIEALLENNQDASQRLKRKWEIGNQNFNHCKKLITAVINDIKMPTCNNCGNVESISSGEQLFRCGACKTVKYCDKLCQKSDWKCHKAACLAKNVFAEPKPGK